MKEQNKINLTVNQLLHLLPKTLLNLRELSCDLFPGIVTLLRRDGRCHYSPFGVPVELVQHCVVDELEDKVKSFLPLEHLN